MMLSSILNDSFLDRNLLQLEIAKFLSDQGKQHSVLLVEEENPVEPDTEIYTFNIERRVAAMYLLSALHYNNTRFAHKLKIYDYKNNEVLSPNGKKFKALVKKMEKWSEGKLKKFPLQEGEVFWKKHTGSSKSIHEKLGIQR